MPRHHLILLILSLGLLGFALAMASGAERRDRPWAGVTLSHPLRS